MFASVTSAQTEDQGGDPGESARFHWGILRFTPSIAVTNIGVDNNVFNETIDPKQDTTAAVGPVADLWIKLGRARVTGTTGGQYLYFKKYANQRSWNTKNQLRLDVPLTHLKPFVAVGYTNTRYRPGFEIDSRSRSASNALMFGSDVRLSGRTSLILSGTRTTTAFDQNETFLGTELAQALNRYSDTEQLQFRYMLTPLTTLVVTNDAIQDRFDIDQTRNADSIRIMPGFEFKPFALISGSVFVGVRHFNSLSETVPDFDGLTAAVDARYSIAATQFGFRVNRDVTFSIDALNPYYTLTDSGLSVTQRITPAWDVVGSGGWQSLDYRRLETAPASAARTDHSHQYGLGAGYRFGNGVRLGLDASYSVRQSQAVLRAYDGLRIGASVSYGSSR